MPINSKLALPGIAWAFDCAFSPRRGNLNVERIERSERIDLLLWCNTYLSFFRFLQGLTDLQDSK